MNAGASRRRGGHVSRAPKTLACARWSITLAEQGGHLRLAYLCNSDRSFTRPVQTTGGFRTSVITSQGGIIFSRPDQQVLPRST